MAIIDNIISEMKKQGITAANLCRLTGITQGNFSDWKSGKAIPKTTSILKISEALNVSADYLLENKLNEKPATKSDELSMKLFNKINKLNPDDKAVLVAQIEAILKHRNNQ